MSWQKSWVVNEANFTEYFWCAFKCSKPTQRPLYFYSSVARSFLRVIGWTCLASPVTVVCLSYAARNAVDHACRCWSSQQLIFIIMLKKFVSNVNLCNWRVFDALWCHMGTAIKHPVPDRVKSSFIIFDIERHSAWVSKITNDDLTRSGTRCL